MSKKYFIVKCYNDIWCTYDCKFVDTVVSSISDIKIYKGNTAGVTRINITNGKLSIFVLPLVQKDNLIGLRD